MEEPKPPQPAPQLSNPSTAPQTLPPQPQPHPPPPPPPPSSTTRKRQLEPDAHLQDSNFFKIRALVRDLRPHFIEVLRTPDYQNCKGSHEIREQLKILMKLYNNLKVDVVSLGKPKNVQDGQHSSGENLDCKTPQEKQPQQVKPSEIRLTPPVPGFEKPQGEGGQTQGTYVVGGSAFGWNFITFSGKEPVYYGVTKEQFRSGKGLA